MELFLVFLVLIALGLFFKVIKAVFAIYSVNAITRYTSEAYRKIPYTFSTLFAVMFVTGYLDKFRGEYGQVG